MISFHVHCRFDCGPAPYILSLGSGLTTRTLLWAKWRITWCNHMMASKDPTWKCCISLWLTNPNMASLVDLHEPDSHPPFRVGKLMLVGQIWPIVCFYTACELRMVFRIFERLKKIKRRIIFSDTKITWNWVCSIFVNKVLFGQSHSICLLSMAVFMLQWQKWVTAYKS